jgi:glutamine amidotransferase
MKNSQVLVIDYKVGNHQSVINAIKFLGYPFLVSGEKSVITKADAYVLPGVGAYGEAITNLRQLGIVDPLKEQVLERKKPLLGICLGMQLLAEDSQEEGFHQGLGWVEGHVVKLIAKDGCRVPHVGWNDLQIVKPDPLFGLAGDEASFYFDHSYQFMSHQEFVAATCWHGDNTIAAVQKGNIFGVQFHPEKSQDNGLKLFKSFYNFVLSAAKQGNI